MSQPSVSPLCDLINECWATRLDPLWGGHIWTLYIEIHICLPLSVSFHLLFRLSLSHSTFCSVFSFLYCLFMHLIYIFLFQLSFSLISSSPLVGVDFFLPSIFFFISFPPSLNHPLLFSPPSLLHGDEALLSPLLPQEPLTSAGCSAEVVPLSLPAGSGSLCFECLNIK